MVTAGPKQLTIRVLVTCLGPGLTEFSSETLRNGNVVFRGCLLLAGGLVGRRMERTERWWKDVGGLEPVFSHARCP